MKRIVLLFAVALFSVGLVCAEDVGDGQYIIFCHARVKGRVHHNDCNNHLQVTISEMSEADFFWRESIKRPEDKWRDYYHADSISASYRNFLLIIIQGNRQYKNTFGLSRCIGDTEIKSYRIELDRQRIIYDAGSLPRWQGNIRMTIYPKDIDVKAKYDDEKERGLFPTDDKIELMATRGFNSSVYKWQYSLSNNLNDTIWRDLPAEFQGKETISVSGKDILGDNVYQMLNYNNIHFRINCLTSYMEFFLGIANKPPRILTLSPRLSAPNIKVTATQKTLCQGNNDGSYTIEFSRNLLSGEGWHIDCDKCEGHGTSINPSDLDGNNSFTFNNIGAGTYEIQVSGYYPDPTKRLFSGGRNHKLPVTITSPSEVNFSGTARDISCYGESDGIITVNASGGTPGYKVHWKEEDEDENAYQVQNFNSASGTQITGFLPGSYEYYVTDSHNCYWRNNVDKEITETVQLTQPTIPVYINEIEAVDPSGYRLSNGWITVNVIGGTPNDDGSYHVRWTNQSEQLQTDFTGTVMDDVFEVILNNARAGTYTLTITDKNSCEYLATYTLDEPDELLVNVEETHYVSCFGMSDGELTAHVTGGVARNGTGLPYRYQWHIEENGSYVAITGATDSIQTNLKAGYYRINITDYSRIPNTASKVFRLTEPFLLVTSVPDKSIICNQTTGLSASTQGGTAPYSYEWNTGDVTQSLSGLGAGKYFVYVTDVRGCRTNAMGTVSMPTDLAAEAFITDPVCYQTSTGSIRLQLTGGTAPYLYLWNNGEEEKDITNLKAGIYAVTIIDNDGCSIFESYELTNPERLTVSLGGDRALCNGQELTLLPEVDDPNTTFEWSGAGFSSTAPQVTLTEEGVYRLTITDSNGCIASNQIKLTVRDFDISSEFVVSSHVAVNDTVIIVNISDPEPYRAEWLTDNIPAEVVETSLHYIKVIFKETGNFPIGMRAHLEDCFKDIMKNIVVIDADESILSDEDQSVIDKFILYPNPNNGTFTANVVLNITAPIRLRIINIGNGMVVNDVRFAGQDDYTVPYNLSLETGVYILALDTMGERMTLKMIVN
jgi:hypothetical protein